MTPMRKEVITKFQFSHTADMDIATWINQIRWWEKKL